ncbi:hypothetical protein ACFL6U_00895 [Planctomycetota bacterium]
MKMRSIILTLSLAINIIVIPYLAWELVGYYVFYSVHIGWCSELAYAAGYCNGKGIDPNEVQNCPVTLHDIKVEPKHIEALVWPRKKQYMRVDFYDEGYISHVTVYRQGQYRPVIPRNK